MKNRQGRILCLDFIRGIAVVLMVQQHLVAWLWNRNGKSLFSLLPDYPVTISINGLGGLAAPLFIIISGFSTMVMWQKREYGHKHILMRGVLIVCVGYILNIATMQWLSFYSWYVLHLIGVGMLLSGMMRKLSTKWMIVYIVIVLCISLLGQTMLDTPTALTNERMRNSSYFGGVFRLAFFEGQFPIFPWLGFFVLGMVCFRFYHDKKIVYQWLLPFAILGVAGVLVILAFWGTLASTMFYRIPMIAARIYPLLMIPALILMALSCVIVTVFLFYETRVPWILENNPLVCLGKCSLSLFCSHIIVFRQLSFYIGFYQSMTHFWTILLTLSILLLIFCLARLWQTVDFKYGLEWCIRKAIIEE